MATKESARSSPGDIAKKILDGPFTGILPWIVLGVFEGPGRVVWAAVAALALSVVFLVIDLARGRSLKILNVVDPIFFAALVVLTQVLSTSAMDWLELWIGEISNITLVVIAVGSMLVRVPFTLQYAREEVSEEFHHAPAFIRANYVITGVWAAAFLVSAIAGFYGDAVLHDSDNIWTGWVIQVGAIIVAIQFSGWYPAVTRARTARAMGHTAEPAPSVNALLAPLVIWLVPVGIIALVVGSGPTWLGVGFIIAGAALSMLLRDRGEQPATPDSSPT